MTRFSKVAFLASMALLFLTGSGITKRLLNGTISAETQNGNNRFVNVQSASGKITAMQDDTFTIEVQQNEPRGQAFRQDDHASSMTFLVSSSTKIEGNLDVGANADVLYRQRDGNNVAVTVRVTATS
jgi:hypothetical protein